MNAPIEYPQLRTCCACLEEKPQTKEFFELRDNGNALVFRKQCRVCRNKANKASAAGATNKRCTSCLAYLSRDAFDGTSSRCVECAGRRGSNPGRTRTPAAQGAPYEPGPKPCGACHDIPWRVLGPRCPCCKLEYAVEPKPELWLRRFDRGNW